MRQRADETLEATDAARAEEQARISQIQDGQREIVRRKVQLQTFGEACEATVDEARETEAFALAEATTGYSHRVTDSAEREIAAHRLRMEAKKIERRLQKEVASAGTKEDES